MQHRHAFSHMLFLLFNCSIFFVLAACSPIDSNVGSATPTQAKATPAPSPGKTLLIYKGSGPVLAAAWSPSLREALME